jgi:LysM repeat protein
MTREEYILEFKSIAVKKMRNFGIPASITLAQGLLESDDGNSELAVNANNHFGIKCHKEWTGKRYFMDDDEKNECFRKYKDARESYEDHSLFLTQRERYNSLFDLDITDYKAWAHGLKRAGYATNPNYAKLLIKIIEDNQLYQYDQIKVEDIYADDITSENIKSPDILTITETDELVPIKIGGGDRKIYVNNGVKYIIARKGDTFYSIASDLDIYTYQVYKYNELDKNDQILEGEILYVGKKKRKGNVGIHIVKKGESMYKISQIYAVRLKNLYKINNMEPGVQPFEGQEIYLR